METIKRSWLTALTVLLAAFSLLLALAIGADNEPTSAAERAFGLIVTLGAGLALLAGMWILRSGKMAREVGLTAIVVGLVGVAVWFWMLFPPILAAVVLWFGVIRGGLARELERGVDSTA